MDPKSIDDGVQIGSGIHRNSFAEGINRGRWGIILDCVGPERSKVGCGFRNRTQEVLNCRIFLDNRLSQFRALSVDLFPAEKPCVKVLILR